MKYSYIFLLLITAVWTRPALAQTDSTSSPVYFETLQNGQTQFYFDEHYFLVAKDCPYKAIERVGKYDIALKNFDGDFVDYNNDGEAVLTGSYQKGKKEGLFTAYFANGQTKWQILFHADIPVDTVRYNYPDGLPMLEIRYDDGKVYVLNFWDTHRRQRVKDGEGKFEFAVKAEGYNEYGYIFTTYKGSIKNGKPDGNWDIFLEYDKGEKDYAGYERFEEGKFKTGYDEINGMPYHTQSKIQIGPSLFFVQAEEMLSKRCTVDEHEDFSMFMMRKLTKAFALYDARNILIQPIRLSIEAKVDKMGTLTSLDIPKGFANKEADRVLLHTLADISYWIPSYGDGVYIDDTLNLTVDVTIDQESGQLQFYNLIIERKDGI